ncbi:MAG: transposase family protein [Sulfuricella sp.]|nr:transposase family protein [Sulfuricella sp.]
MNNKITNWSQLRFSIIGGLLARPPEPGKLGEEIKCLASRRYRHPQKDEWISFGASTIERWYYRALKSVDPVGALNRKVRVDAGEAQAMSTGLLAALGEQYRNFPHWSYQLHADNLAALVGTKPELGEAPSYSTVRRRMKARGWTKKQRPKTAGQHLAAERLEHREVRSYEHSHVHALWHLDFHSGSRRIVDSQGVWHTPKALCVLDDCSRLCCHIQWYLDETAESLVHGLTQAFHKRGLPRSLMTDNGSAMIAGETKNGLLQLGVEHLTTLPYSPYQNGKQESFWGQLEGRLIAMLSGTSLTLEFLNRATQAWVEMEYNRSNHEEIATSPLSRLLQGPDVSRPGPTGDILRLAFTVRETRMQRKSDGTLQISGVRFEVPARFRHLDRLYVRFPSWDLGQAYLVDERTGLPLVTIHPLDKAKNNQGKRRLISSIPDTTLVPGSGDSVAPLLSKLLGDYAATGLPSAYLPKDEDK